jgi:hypothetical protein
VGAVVVVFLLLLRLIVTITMRIQTLYSAFVLSGISGSAAALELAHRLNAPSAEVRATAVRGAFACRYC